MKTIELTEPVQYLDKKGNSQNLDRIVFGKLKAKHLKYIPKNLLVEDNANVQPHEMIPFIAALADIPKAAVNEISFEDFSRVVEALGDVLGESGMSPKTGMK